MFLIGAAGVQATPPRHKRQTACCNAMIESDLVGTESEREKGIREMNETISIFYVLIRPGRRGGDLHDRGLALVRRPKVVSVSELTQQLRRRRVLYAVVA